MIKKEICQQVLEECLKTGGDFAEIFAEDTEKNIMELTSGKVTQANTTNLHGVAIRILKGFKEVSGYTNDFSLESLLKLAKEVRGALNGEPLDIKFELKEEKANKIIEAVRKPSTVSNEEKVNYLLKTYNAIKDYSNEITQTICFLTDEEQKVLVANTLGKYIEDERNHLRLGLSVVASYNGEMQSAF